MSAPHADRETATLLGDGETPVAGPTDGSHAEPTLPAARASRRAERRPRSTTYLLAGSAYAVLSVILWWHLWAHPTTVTTCGCGDSALTLWVLQWPAYALAHGHNPFFSSALFHPVGINMAPNSLGLGIVFAPVTWLFGPVATANVITAISSPLSALSMMWLLRRWTSWSPAAFVGGFFYGFSPFIVVSLALAHPNFGLLVLPPLVIACLDEILVRQRHSWCRSGLLLGVLLTLQFFVSVEILLLVVGFGVIAIALIVLHRWLRDPAGLVQRAGHSWRALATAFAVAAVLLAYPLWFFFAGPAHLSGRAWPSSPAGIVGATPMGFVNGFLGHALVATMHVFGGYQGPPLPLLSFVGIGVVIVVAAGMVAWHRDARLWLFGALAVVAGACALGVTNDHWTPWRIAVHLPVLNNVVPINVSAITDLCLAVLLGLVVDHTRSAMTDAPVPRLLAPIAVSAVALVPVAAALWPNIPMTTRAVTLPRWFATEATRLPPGQVVLPYPAALGGVQASMAWQAVDGISFAMVGGGGPGVVASRAGEARPGFEVLAAASLPLSPPPEPSSHNLGAIRRAVQVWGVTRIVVPDQPGLPTYSRGRDVSYAVGLFTAATGRTPVRRADALVWAISGVRALPPSRAISTAAFDACVSGPAAHGGASVVAACVLRGG